MNRHALLVVLIGLVGCSVDPKPAPSPAATLSNVPEPAIAPPAPAVAGATQQQAANIPNEGNNASLRDPFALGAAAIVPVTPPPTTKRDEIPRKARKYSIDQLKLVGIVSGEEQRAMLIDPRGKGWIVERGDHVGRPDLATDHVVGWRVQKIKSDEIVFIREDATRSDRAPETRVLALHAEITTNDMDD